MKKQNRKPAAYLMLLLSLIVHTYLQAQTRLGLHVTQEELNIWKQRAASGPYKSRGDVSSNSPDDWARIVRNADAFLANPSSEFFVGYTGSGCVPKWSVEPQNKAEKLRDASFAFLITGNTAYSKAVRAALLKQAAEPSTNFGNASKWCPGFLRDINPGFFYATWMTRMFFAYDYIKHTLSSTDKQILENWFYQAALYFQYNIDADLNKLWIDRNNGNYTLTSYSTNSNIGGTTHITHYNGYKVPHLASWYNNRRAAQIQFATLVGIHRNDAKLKKSGKLFVKEWLMYSTFADGTIGEFERWGSNSPEQGWQYGMIVIDFCLSIVDHLARVGDMELYNYKTSQGRFGTEGGNKSLQLVMTNMLKYINRSHNRYATSDPSRYGNNNYRIDGISPMEGKHYVFDTWVAQANILFRDEFLKSVYLRRASGTSAYPSNPTGSGSYIGWTGGFGLYPGKLFMFGQMEGRVDPFPDQSSIVINPVEDEEPSSSETGSITREYWSNVSGTTISSMPISSTPNSTTTLPIFEAGTNIGDNYATRIRGFVHAPTSGNYTFWIAGDDNCELWLSTDENPANKRKIAYISGGWAAFREWNKFSSQKSTTISLQAGKKYYVEVLHKEGVGGDNIAVGWQLPNGMYERPIPGTRLSPYTVGSTARVAAQEAAEKVDVSLQAYPNPFSDVVTLSIGQNSGQPAMLTLVNNQGKIQYQTKIELSATDSSISLDLSNKGLASGLYFLTIDLGNGIRKTIKLMKI